MSEPESEPAYDPESDKKTGPPPPLPPPGSIPERYRAALARRPGWREDER